MNSPGKESVEISVIVPILNEADRLPVLLHMLGQQTGVRIEVLLCDGGSEDGSPLIVQSLQSDFSFPCQFLSTPRGRGAQLNAGAEKAAGQFLLFLHADSRFAKSDALQVALRSYQAAIYCQDELVAGHFRLRFEDAPDALIDKMAYWEIKASLNRPGCTHGDQGFFMHRHVYQTVGPFVEDWPMFEDTLFAEAMRGAGRWILLSSDLLTSARRFDSEGLIQRQTLNALLMNFRDVGWHSYFETAKSIYRHQDQTGQLRLWPFLQNIREQLAALSLTEQASLWYRTGRYVRSNAWQLILASKVRSGVWTPDTSTHQIESALSRFDRRFDLLTGHPVGYTLVAFLTWLWFRLLCLREN